MVSGRLARIIEKAMDPDVEQRYQSARELSEDVENYLAARPTTASRRAGIIPRLIERAELFVYRNRVSLGVLTLGTAMTAPPAVALVSNALENNRARERAGIVAREVYDIDQRPITGADLSIARLDEIFQRAGGDQHPLVQSEIQTAQELRKELGEFAAYRDELRQRFEHFQVAALDGVSGSNSYVKPVELEKDTYQDHLRSLINTFGAGSNPDWIRNLDDRVFSTAEKQKIIELTADLYLASSLRSLPFYVSGAAITDQSEPNVNFLLRQSEQALGEHKKLLGSLGQPLDGFAIKWIEASIVSYGRTSRFPDSLEDFPLRSPLDYYVREVSYYVPHSSFQPEQLEILNQGLVNHPSSSLLLLERARWYSVKKDIVAAVVDASRALAIDNESLHARLVLGASLYQMMNVETTTLEQRHTAHERIIDLTDEMARADQSGLYRDRALDLAIGADHLLASKICFSERQVTNEARVLFESALKTIDLLFEGQNWRYSKHVLHLKLSCLAYLGRADEAINVSEQLLPLVGIADNPYHHHLSTQGIVVLLPLIKAATDENHYNQLLGMTLNKMRDLLPYLSRDTCKSLVEGQLMEPFVTYEGGRQYREFIIKARQRFPDLSNRWLVEMDNSRELIHLLAHSDEIWQSQAGDKLFIRAEKDWVEVADGKIAYRFTEASRGDSGIVLFDNTRKFTLELQSNACRVKLGPDAEWHALYEGSWKRIE